MPLKDKALQVKQDFDDVYEAGKQAQYDEFWDVFQDYGNRRYYSSAFPGIISSSNFWNEQNFTPKYDIILNDSVNASDNMFIYSPMKNLEAHLNNLGVKLDTSQAPRLNSCFDRSKITHAPPLDMSSCKEMIRVFYLVTTLKKATLLNIREDCVFTNPFSSCSALEELIVTGIIGQDINLQWSKKLTLESLISLIDCLKQYLDEPDNAYTKTITLSAESWALLKEDGEANFSNGDWWEDQIYNKGWNFG